ncbi:MAG: NADH-quinone oxidoreductase subunit M [Blastochloris sp.]|nr:NADH-quinone oxidoreductase subunit M [Blastochloris sp.]
MNFLNYLPLAMVVFPVLACLAIALGAPVRKTALATVVLNLALVLVVACFIPHTQGYHFVTSFPCISLPNFFEINLTLGVDGLSLAMILLTAVVSVAAVAVSPLNVRREAEFYICVLLISCGAMGAFLSLDLFFLYVFHEVALIPTFLLIGIWGGQDRKFAATQMTIYLAAGSLILLVGILGFYFALPEGARSMDLRVIHEILSSGRIPVVMQNIIYPLLIMGFGILISLFPFHHWAPAGYAAAPAPAAMLHAGVLKKFGLYGLLRLVVPYLPEGAQTFGNILLILLLVNILYIGLVTVAQKELNLMLGFSSVMHMGYIFLGLASGTPIGLTGAVILMVSHGLSAALLFGLASVIREKTGTTLLKDMGGLAIKAPMLAFLFITGALASMGTPGLGNFAGEVLIFFGAWKVHPWTTFFAIWGIVISAVYYLRAVRSIFFGELKTYPTEVKDFKGLAETWPYVLLVGMLVAIGIYPAWLIKWIEPSINLITNL